MAIAPPPPPAVPSVPSATPATGGGDNQLANGSGSTAALRDIMLQGAWESVAIAKIQLEAQRVANIAKAWSGFASMIKSGAQGLSQVG